MRRACLKIQSGPAALGFGGSQDGQGGASPQRADCLRAAHVNSRQLIGRGLGSQMAEPTPANAKKRAAGTLLISRPAHHAVNRVPAETDCPGWGLGKTGGEVLLSMKSTRPVGIHRILVAATPSRRGSNMTLPLTDPSSISCYTGSEREYDNIKNRPLYV